MNWSRWRLVPWLDTRAKFVASLPARGLLLDLGTSDGNTLSHFAELRPDLSYSAVDISPAPPTMPPGTRFLRADLEKDRIAWEDGSFDAITCMHLVEHLRATRHLWSEAMRLLKPGGRIYVETPGRKSLTTAGRAGRKGAEDVTLNFYDDPTHIDVVSIEQMNAEAADAGLVVERSGTARNWLFTLAYPILRLLPARRQRYVALLHWLGWSNYVIAAKPAGN